MVTTIEGRGGYCQVAYKASSIGLLENGILAKGLAARLTALNFKSLAAHIGEMIFYEMGPLIQDRQRRLEIDKHNYE